ncbi:TPA: hypothetical protein ANIA_11546 [Aspergillus nidulans FGSC A4]|uniref:Uncharacterized protein n=1 Tax=Emericella nidulans (strain FGSC A4 / ATCC 38163 / CBS 112.46 / NRRL 194 / M139) TaxID=227321 RepID=C8VDA5_EMENI|nr:TPA: hypothetical protein ANIA_11546 [Aspergillus nidulans FGSC A4]
MLHYQHAGILLAPA